MVFEPFVTDASGTTYISPVTGTLPKGEFPKGVFLQLNQAEKNLLEVLRQAGLTPLHVVYVRVYVKPSLANHSEVPYIELHVFRRVAGVITLCEFPGVAECMIEAVAFKSREATS